MINWLRNFYGWFIGKLSPESYVRDVKVIDEALLQHNERTVVVELHPKGVSTFDPNSNRAKKGIAFQKSVYEQLQEEFPGNDTFEECWDYFKKQDPELLKEFVNFGSLFGLHFLQNIFQRFPFQLLS